MVKNHITALFLLVSGITLRLSSFALVSSYRDFSRMVSLADLERRAGAINDLAMGLFYIGGLLLIGTLLLPLLRNTKPPSEKDGPL